jgi:hypothetical protein
MNSLESSCVLWMESKHHSSLWGHRQKTCIDRQRLVCSEVNECLEVFTCCEISNFYFPVGWVILLRTLWTTAEICAASCVHVHHQVNCVQLLKECCPQEDIDIFTPRRTLTWYVVGSTLGWGGGVTQLRYPYLECTDSMLG